jgi:energy-coupling factor transporter ATP-binding protein EcfA2
MSSSLAVKYTPKTFDEYIFETEKMKKAIETMIKEGVIKGHVLMLGESGTGKSSFIEIWRRHLITESKKTGRLIRDVRSIKDYKIDELREIEKLAKLKTNSKHYVVFEEFQYSNVSKTPSFLPTFKRIASQKAFQEKVTILATSNSFVGFETAIRERFTYVFRFTRQLTDYKLPQILNRVMFILNAEYGITDDTANRKKVEDWLINFNVGAMRPILNEIQIYGDIPTINKNQKDKRISSMSRLVKSVHVVNDFLKTLSLQERHHLFTGDKRVSADTAKKWNSYIEAIYKIASESEVSILDLLDKLVSDKSFNALAQLTFIKVALEFGRGDPIVNNAFGVLSIHNSLLRAYVLEA